MIIKYNNKIVTKSHKWCSSNGATPIPPGPGPGPGPGPEPDPYNPLNLPAGTIRVRTSDGNVPYKGSADYETATLVPGTTDVYDVYRSGTSFYDLFYGSNNITEVLGANTTGINNMGMMFMRCSSLTSVPLFDTSSVTYMGAMFQSCSSLTSVPLFDTSNVTHIACMFMACSSLKYAPLFDTSNVTNMNYMFYGCSSLTNVPLLNTSKVTDMDQAFIACRKVQSGALALYQQASSQATPPRNHISTFAGCGADTVTGAAELVQIPHSWGGTKPIGS